MRTNRDMRLTRAIRLALGSGLAAAMAFGPVANAAEEEDAAELERVQVTGSRISRLDIEGATPVVTIDREDLDNSGFQSVADYLRSNAFNSFGSIREESGNTAQGQATISLRGLGSNRTLILIDGRRLPGSPVLDGQIQNLNTIPFAAVERIEILSDGASAIYGSDAIGGVVNIILRKDFEGGEISVRGTDPDRPGGAERGISIVNGFAGDRGRMTFAFEADHQDTILANDRFYTKNNLIGTDPTDFNSYSNLSFYGRNIVDYDSDGSLATPFDGTFIAYPMMSGVDLAGATPNAAGAVGGAADVASGEPVCAQYGEGFWPQVLADSQFPGDYVCGYDYTGVAATTAELNRLSAFMDAEYEINSDLLFTTQLLAARVNSWGRYAPAAAPLQWTAASLPAEEITYNGETYTLNPITTGDYIFYRWNNIGPARDTYQNDYQYDMQVGLEGFNGGVQWNVNYQYDLYDLQEWGEGYLANLGAQQIARNGWDPRHPNQTQFTGAADTVNAAGNSNRRAQMEMQRVDIGAQFDGPMMDAGPVMFFVGGEYSDQEYYDQVIAQVEAGNVGGTAGGSSGGSRSNWAVFGEASLPFTDTFELNPAVRYDSYSDFGTNVSYKLAARFQPVDYFVLRGSYGTGFRAPSLDELYQSPAFSASFADDLVACQNAGVSLSDCIAQPDNQFDTYINNNPDLDAEKSSQYLLGGVFDFNEFNGTDLTLSLDYYYTEIEDVVTNISTQDAFWLEYLGQLGQFPAISVMRAPTTGRHIENQVAPVNFASFDTSGLDFRVNYGQSLGGAGDLAVNFQFSHVLEYNAQDVLVGPLVDVTGRFGIPEWRANLDVAWTMGRHTVSLFSWFVPAMCNNTTLNPNFDATDFGSYYQVCDPTTGDVDSYANHNLVYSFEAPWNARIQFGVNNLTDEDPVLTNNLSTDTSIYPLVSRAYVASYTQRF